MSAVDNMPAWADIRKCFLVSASCRLDKKYCRFAHEFTCHVLIKPISQNLSLRSNRRRHFKSLVPYKCVHLRSEVRRRIWSQFPARSIFQHPFHRRTSHLFRASHRHNDRIMVPSLHNICAQFEYSRSDNLANTYRRRSQKLTRTHTFAAPQNKWKRFGIRFGCARGIRSLPSEMEQKTKSSFFVDRLVLVWSRMEFLYDVLLGRFTMRLYLYMEKHLCASQSLPVLRSSTRTTAATYHIVPLIWKMFRKAEDNARRKKWCLNNGTANSFWWTEKSGDEYIRRRRVIIVCTEIWGKKEKEGENEKKS